MGPYIFTQIFCKCKKCAPRMKGFGCDWKTKASNI